MTDLKTRLNEEARAALKAGDNEAFHAAMRKVGDTSVSRVIYDEEPQEPQGL